MAGTFDGSLTWVGHATFLLETPGGARVLLDAFVDPAKRRLASIVPPVDDPQKAITLIGKPTALQRIPAHLVTSGAQLLELGQLPLAQ